MRIQDPKWVWLGYNIRYNAKTISILAVAETIAATWLALYATFAWGATKWFALYICIAPLLLLKTKRSVRRGLALMERSMEWFSRWILYWEYYDKGRGFTRLLWFLASTLALSPVAMTFVCWVLVGPLIIKPIVTVTELVQNGWVSLRRIPRNWIHTTLQTDLSILPEMLPEASRNGSRFGLVFRMLSAVGISRSAWEASTVLGKCIRIALSPSVFVTVCFVGLGYRWALKATSLFWVLFIFLTHPIFRPKDSLAWRVADIIEVPWSKAERVWAAAIIVAHLLLPLFFWQWYSGLTQGWLAAAPQMHDLLEYLVVTALPIKGWHIAAGIGAILTWVIWVLAHKYRIAMKYTKDGLTAPEERRALHIIQVLLGARALCLTYTTFSGLVAVFKTLHLVSVDVRWLP